jgi:hypothetical protein
MVGSYSLRMHSALTPAFAGAFSGEGRHAPRDEKPTIGINVPINVPATLLKG